jgi:cytochrome P450
MQAIAYTDFTARSIAPPAGQINERQRVRGALKFLDGVVAGIIDRGRRPPPECDNVLSSLWHAADQQGNGDSVYRRVRDETLMLLLAGNATTATAITWAVYALAKHPSVQARAAREVDQVMGGQPATAETVNLLSFTERAFFEALRQYPPAYTTSRQAIEPVEIGGYRLPAGAQVHLIPYLTHRDPRWFNDPQTFRPDRFAPDAERPIPRFAFIPFGAGPRACVGGGLALMEGLLVVATILQRCRLQLAAGQHEPELEPLIALHPKGGIRLRLLSRPELARPTGQ